MAYLFQKKKNHQVIYDYISVPLVYNTQPKTSDKLIYV